MTTAVAFWHPGDKYALWAVGALPGVWFPVLIGARSLTAHLVFTLLAGAVVTAGAGAVLDRLRVRWLPWHVFWMVMAGAICVVEIASFPSWGRAMSKNGSFQACALFSLNAGLMLSTLATIPAVPTSRAVRRLITRVVSGGERP